MKKVFNKLVKAGVIPEGTDYEAVPNPLIKHLDSVHNEFQSELKEANKRSDTIAKEQSKKSLTVTSEETSKEIVRDIVLIGNKRNQWVLLTKAYSETEGWMKSTKAMACSRGVLVQVTTQQGDSIAEAVVFIPDTKLIKDAENDCWYLA